MKKNDKPEWAKALGYLGVALGEVVGLTVLGLVLGIFMKPRIGPLAEVFGVGAGFSLWLFRILILAKKISDKKD